MNDFRRNFILILCFIPFFRDLLKLLYNLALRKVKTITEHHQEIVDIFLTSNMTDRDFIYGSSELDLIFVVENSSHPREILINLRKSLQGVWPVNMLVDLNSLHVFKEAEIQTPLIRSYLSAKRSGPYIQWKSIISSNIFEYKLKEQDHFAIQRTYIKKIEIFLLNKVKVTLTNRHWIRSLGKNIYHSVLGLHKYGIIKSTLEQNWHKYAKKIIGLSWFSRMYLMGFKVWTLKFLDFDPIPKHKGLNIPHNYPNRLNLFVQKLLQHSIIEDVILCPALIQLDSDQIRGKIYIDIVLGQSRNIFNANSIYNIQHLITDFINNSDADDVDIDIDEPKYVFSFTTYSILKIKAQFLLSENPLEHIYRYQSCHSYMQVKYNFTPHKKQMDKAALYFLLSQFMRFRSMEHKTHLIGSRFIKSLNIIYRYHLLLEHLKGKEFAISHSYKSIMDELTPQLSSLKANDEVTIENWKIIRAQMLFYLKKIRDELAKRHPSIRNLQF